MNTALNNLLPLPDACRKGNWMVQSLNQGRLDNPAVGYYPLVPTQGLRVWTVAWGHACEHARSLMIIELRAIQAWPLAHSSRCQKSLVLVVTWTECDVPEWWCRSDDAPRSIVEIIIAVPLRRCPIPPSLIQDSEMRPRVLSRPRFARQLHVLPPLRHPRSAPGAAHDGHEAPRSRSAKWLRRAGVVGVVAGAVYLFDRECNASALSRSVRTGYIG